MFFGVLAVFALPPRDNWKKTKVENSQTLAKNWTDLGVSQDSTGWMKTISPAWSLLEADIRMPNFKLCVRNLEP